MSGERLEIECRDGYIIVDGCEYYDHGDYVLDLVTAIRQQARDIELLRGELADMTEQRDAWRRRAEESEPHLMAQSPGVQGLAQLGRNAIGRVAQLEASNVKLTAAIAMIARAIGVDERVQIGDLLSRLHALLAANRDLQSHFDALKADYDAMKLSAEQAKAETDRIRVVGRPADTGFIPVVAAPVPVPKIAGVAK